MNEEEFTEIVKRDCEKNKITFVIADKVMMDDVEVNGYFCNEEMALKVSTHNDNWFPTLVHEYCHMKQFLSGYKPFMKLGEVEEEFWNVLNGVMPSLKAKNTVQLVEYDCEKRVLAMIDSLDLPMDKEEYARRSNAYIYFYDVIMKTGLWYDIGNEPYNNDNILNNMPDVLDKDYKNVSEDILEMMIKELYGDPK